MPEVDSWIQWIRAGQLITHTTADRRGISMAVLVSCPQVPQGDVISRDGGYALQLRNPELSARYLLLQSGSKPVLSQGVSSHMVIMLWSPWPVELSLDQLQKLFSIPGWLGLSVWYVWQACTRMFRTHGRLPLSKEATEIIDAEKYFDKM